MLNDSNNDFTSRQDRRSISRHDAFGSVFSKITHINVCEKIESFLNIKFKLLDTGSGGFRISGSMPLPTKTLMTFEFFETALDGPLKVKGKILWRKPCSNKDRYIYGIKFCD